MNLAAVLATVRWQLVGWLSSEQIITARHIIVILEHAVVNLGCDSPWAERILDKSMASQRTIGIHLSTALACTLFIFFACHTFASVMQTVSVASFTINSRRL